MGSEGSGNWRPGVWTAFIVVGFLFLTPRALTLDQHLSRDEYILKYEYLVNDFPENFIGTRGQPPLFQLPHSIMASLVGTGDYAFRLTPLIASALTLLLLFQHVRDRAGVRYAIAAVALTTILPWHIQMSTRILQASQLTLFTLASLVYADRYHRTLEWKNLLLASSLAYVATATMLTAVVLPVAFTLQLIFSNKLDVEGKVKAGTAYIAFYCILSAATFAALYLVAPGSAEEIINHTTELSVSKRGFIPVLGTPSVMILLLWTGPIIVYAAYLTVKRGSLQDTHAIFILACVLVFFGLNADPYRPFDRYFMVALPSVAVAIISYGRDAVDEIMGNPRLYAAAGFSSLILMAFTASVHHETVPLEPKMDFVGDFIGSLGGGMVPYSSNAGPVGFYVPGLMLVVGWGVTAALLISHHLRGGVRLLAGALVVITCFNLAVTAYQTSLTPNANPNASADDLVEQLGRLDLEDTVYVYIDEGVRAYVPADKKVIMFTLGDYVEKTRGAVDYTVLVVDFPKIPEDHAVWKDLADCRLQYESMEHGVRETIHRCGG